jgi:predicted metal-dependent enzyme (double-stranded beta helix superfamily)
MVLAMKHRDLLVTDAGEWRVCKPSREWDLLRTPYRFHRFLTEVEDVLNEAIDETDCLPQLWLLVRRLITNSYWIQTQTTPVNPETGTGVIMLYDEIGYPLTVQIAKTEPGTRTTIHNHGNWGIVALLKGEEKNMLWKRIQDPKFPNRIEPTAEVTLLPGDIISFTPNAIHSVLVAGEEPTITFSIYGETYHSKRFEFDPVAHTAKNF